MKDVFVLFIMTKKTTFQKLRDRDKSVSIHNRNLQVLAIEMYKVKKGLTPEGFCKHFHVQKPTNYNMF